MHWTAPGRCLIAWDGGQGPTFARGPDGYLKRKAFAGFDIYRTTDPADATGVQIGHTQAEAFLDLDAPSGKAVWYRVVGNLAAGGTLAVGARTLALIPAKANAGADVTPPSPPDNLRVRMRSAGNLLQWSAASDAESGLLAYLVYGSNQSQPDAVVWANDEVRAGSRVVRSFLDRTADRKKSYALRAIDCALNVSDAVFGPRAADGWTVYTFNASSEFTLSSGVEIEADILVVGGGGSGGPRSGAAGGGGAGGVKCMHGVTIVGGENDGAVIVGEGAPEVYPGEWVNDPVWGWVLLPIDPDPSTFFNGEGSSFGGLSVLGGGYGAADPRDMGIERVYVTAAAGASGGGGDCFSAGGVPDGGGLQHGHGGLAIADPYTSKTYIPYAGGDVTLYWAYIRENGHAGGVPTGSWTDGAGGEFWTVARDSGNDGGDGTGWGAWYWEKGGGGGGAHERYQRDANGEFIYFEGTTDHVPYFTYDQFGFMQSGNSEHGGHGMPCDIRGWHGYVESGGSSMFIDWYGGGGAGSEKKTWWSYTHGKPGYGGGGDINEEGVDGTGGGGGGAWDPDVGSEHPGPKGGDGIVVVRIRTADEDLVTYPLISGTDPEETEFGLPVCLTGAEGVEIRRLPESMTHNDECGDEQCPRTYEETH